MINYWNIYRPLCAWAFKKALKVVFYLLCAIFLLWQFALKKPVYQHLYATPSSMILNTANGDIFQNLSSPITPGVIKGRDWSVRVTFLKQFQTTAKLVYVDRYNAIGTWYRSSQYKRNAQLYDSVVPVDLSWATGPMDYPNLFQDFDFNNEYRAFIIKSKKPRVRYIPQHISNNHSIPANKNIEKALSILKAGDTAYIEGYLVNINGLGQDSNFEITSALDIGEVSHQLYGGQKSGKCRLIYITRIIFDGYEFK